MSNRDLKSSLKYNGYSTEEIYFQKLNQELIEKMREEKKHLRLVQGGKDAGQLEKAKTSPRKKAA